MEGANEGRNLFLPRVDNPKGNFRLRFDGDNFTNKLPEGVRMHSDDVELSLGLSLGGPFGVKGKAAEPSTDNFFGSPSFPSSPFPPPGLPKISVVAPSLVRTCSLSVETEEEHRQRRELQALKRLEAKRKRMEKMTARAGMSSASRGKSGEAFNVCEKKALLPPRPPLMPVIIGGTNHRFGGGGQHVGVGGRKLTAPTVLPAWPSLLVPKVDPMVPTANDDEPPGFTAPPNSPESTESSSAPPARKFGGRATRGNLISSSSNHGEAYYNINNNVVDALPLNDGARMAVAVGEQPPKEGTMDNGPEEPSRRIMEKMPSVTYRGDGANGRKVDGFLYKYKNGGLNIVCLCHGTFFTPAEFVRHAGGDDIENPLKHIVVGRTSYTPWN